MKGVICFQIKGANAEGIWIVDCKNGNGSVKFGGPGKIGFSKQMHFALVPELVETQ